MTCNIQDETGEKKYKEDKNLYGYNAIMSNNSKLVILIAIKNLLVCEYRLCVTEYFNEFIGKWYGCN